MIQNLNFYDLYGYLIPGLTLAILIWLPRGLIVQRWPTADWTSALIAVVIGYVLGHLVQILGRNALPSTTMNGRFPSEALLDSDDKNFSPTLKERLRTRIKELSGIDVRTDVNKSNVTEEISVQRADGFRYCRDALLSSKTISYGEQMQGMYTLMDGLTVAFALGAPFALGWALSGLAFGTFQIYGWLTIALGLLEVVVIAAIGSSENPTLSPTERARLMFSFLILVLFGFGYLLGVGTISTINQRGALIAITLVCTFASFSCYSAYKYFTVIYAQTIYRAFTLYEKPSGGATAKTGMTVGWFM